MKSLLINFVLLILIGLAAVYSSTYKSLIGAGEYPWKHFFELLVLIVLIFIVYVIVLSNHKFFYNLVTNNIKIIYGILVIFLFLVLTGLGTNAGGAKSSISLLGFNFQPVEIFKLVTILYMAKILSEDNKKLTDEEFIKKKLLLPGISIILVLLEPDTGGAVILLSLILIMLFLNNKKTKLVLKLTAWLVVLGTIGVFVLNKIGYDRITSWLNPFEHLDSAGQNLLQSYIAISNGGLFGVGFLNSVQNSGFLFASSTDFIFSIIAEEFGIIGALTVIIVIFTFSYQIYLVGCRSKKKYDYLVCSGIAFLFLIQAAVNIGGVTGIIPMTGVPLPFISRGINSYISLSFAVLYVIIIHIRTKEEKNASKNKEKSIRKKRTSSRTR